MTRTYRAKRTGDPAAEVRRTVAEWDATGPDPARYAGVWPDDWHLCGL